MVARCHKHPSQRLLRPNLKFWGSPLFRIRIEYFTITTRTSDKKKELRGFLAKMGRGKPLANLDWPSPATGFN